MTHSVLFDANRHETLSRESWSEDQAIATIHSIIRDAISAQLANGSWPLHPLDAQSYPNSQPKWALYTGAAGVVIGLNILRRYGYHQNDFNDLLPNIYSNYLTNPDVKVEPGLQLGETGILVPWLLADSGNVEVAHCLQERMQATLSLPYFEITSGQSGMMHAALYLYQKNGGQCWKDLYVQGAETLLQNWQQDPATGQWLWRSEVFGQPRRYYGACHGVAGNTNILLMGMDLREKDDTNLIIDRSVSTLNLAAIKHGNLVNWFNYLHSNDGKRLVQWCHGAAGVVTALAGSPQNKSPQSSLLDQLLSGAGELVWSAGPLIKGPGLCHGTAGNGYAFLSLYQRWQDKQWLDRARKFAMHAIEQSHQHQVNYAQGRYSLWTGDVGLAIFLHHCISPEETALPGLELF